VQARGQVPRHRAEGERFEQGLILKRGKRMEQKKSRPSSGKRKLAAGKAWTLAELISYAPGSVVSRTLAENAAGTVTLFAFDAGQGLSEHSAPYDALVQVLDGEAQLKIGGKAVPARAGQLVVMPANVPHSVQAVKKFKMLLTMLRAG
jgi:quercetin dioxygenase-like cupin family protein